MDYNKELTMKNLLYVLIATMLFSLVACEKSSDQTKPDDDINHLMVQALIDSLWQDYQDENEIQEGGLLFCAQKGEQRYYAQTNLPDEVDKYSFFRAASITKTFTAASIMLLKEKNKLDINATITSNIPGSSEAYIPDTEDFAIPYKEQITIAQLLEHSAGVWDPINCDIPDSIQAPYAGQNWIDYIMTQDAAHHFTTSEIIGVVAEHGLSFNSPGSEYHYSNTGYMLLGEIIERVSGKDYRQFIRDEILEPNALSSMDFPTDALHLLPEPKIPCYVYFEGELLDFNQYNMSMEKAQGNLVTNADDLLTWLVKWQKGTAGIGTSSIQDMRQPSALNPGYGYGTEIIEGLGYGHTGALAGFLSFMFYDPTQDTGFVLLCNMWNMNDEESFNELAYLLFDIAAQAKALIADEEEISPPKDYLREICSPRLQ